MSKRNSEVLNLHQNSTCVSFDLDSESLLWWNIISFNPKAMRTILKLGVFLSESTKISMWTFVLLCWPVCWLPRQQHRSFVSQTGDEKWCVYINVKNRKEWFSSNKKVTPQSKTGTHLLLWTISIAEIYCHISVILR